MKQLNSPCPVVSHQPGLVLAGLLALSVFAVGGIPADASFSSPGFAPSRLDAQARLVEDWGAIQISVSGEGIAAGVIPAVRSLKVGDIVPAAEARFDYGSIAARLTAYRAPVWPSGVDVLTVHLQETADRENSVRLTLELPEGVRVGARTVFHGGRAVVSLPAGAAAAQAKRDWGWLDDAASLPGWARPARECDPAFRNIRAGLGGVPIRYHFSVEPRAAVNVVLGLCESHWSQIGARPVVCKVEGSPPQTVDPLARWGQHQPGALSFAGKDENGDGKLDVSVLPAPGAPDLNPILNVIWLFPPAANIDLEQVIAGKCNEAATLYVDVGGEKDQSLLAGGKVEYAIKLAAKGSQELTFLVACQGASVPMPERTAWTLESLRRSAIEVWRDWR